MTITGHRPHRQQLNTATEKITRVNHKDWENTNMPPKRKSYTAVQTEDYKICSRKQWLSSIYMLRFCIQLDVLLLCFLVYLHCPKCWMTQKQTSLISIITSFSCVKYCTESGTKLLPSGNVMLHHQTSCTFFFFACYSHFQILFIRKNGLWVQCWNICGSWRITGYNSWWIISGLAC